MIYTLSPIYDEEILYSWLSRNYKYFPYSPIEYSKFIMGNNRTQYVNFNIGLDYMLKLLSNNNIHLLNSDEDFINTTTLLPFYTKFQKNSDVVNSFNRLRYSLIRSPITTSLHLHDLDFNPNIINLKFCPECAEQQYQQYGEIYLLREHQIYNNNACYIHKCMLNYYPMRASSIFYNINDFYGKQEAISFDNNSLGEYIQLSELVHYIFTLNKSLAITLKLKLKKAAHYTSKKRINFYCRNCRFHINIKTPDTDTKKFINNSSTFEIILLLIACYELIEDFIKNPQP